MVSPPPLAGRRKPKKPLLALACAKTPCFWRGFRVREFVFVFVFVFAFVCGTGRETFGI